MTIAGGVPARFPRSPEYKLLQERCFSGKETYEIEIYYYLRQLERDGVGLKQ